MIGIYKLIHTKTGKYYIGSSVNIKNRYQTHLSFLKSGKNIKRLQELYNQDPNFELVVLEECRKCDLIKKEGKYLKSLVRIDPYCVNHQSKAVANLRNKKKSDLHKERLSQSMLGKNGNHTRKNKLVTLVSPTGKEYSVTSIKKFAEKNKLSQSALNSVATGQLMHHKGWTLKGTTLTKISRSLPDFMKPDIKIISPDGEIYIIKSIHQFEKENNVTVVNYSPNSKFKSTTFKGDGLDIFGKAWYVAGMNAYTFKNWKTGQVIENVISHSTLAKHLGISFSVMRRMVHNLENDIPQRNLRHGWKVEKYIVQEK